MAGLSKVGSLGRNALTCNKGCQEINTGEGSPSTDRNCSAVAPEERLEEPLETKSYHYIKVTHIREMQRRRDVKLSWARKLLKPVCLGWCKDTPKFMRIQSWRVGNADHCLSQRHPPSDNNQSCMFSRIPPPAQCRKL